MNWLEEWAKYEVIGMWVGIGITCLFALASIIWFVVLLIKLAYQKHSKKYIWDCTKNKYVKKEDFYR